MDFEMMFRSMIELLRQHGLTVDADDALDCWNHGESSAGILVGADALLRHGIKPGPDILDAYGIFAKDTDGGLGFDDTDLTTYEGLKAL